MKTTEEAKGEYAEKHAFRVPYDGSNKFYDEVDFKASEDGFKAGIEFAQRWIPIEEELPPPITPNEIFSYQVLVELKDGGYRIMQYDHYAKLFFPHRINEIITHWRPIELK